MKVREAWRATVHVLQSQDTTSRPNTTTTVVQSNQTTILPFQTALKVSKIN